MNSVRNGTVLAGETLSPERRYCSMGKPRPSFLLAALAFAALVASRAEATSLLDLTNGGSIQVGDKLFSDFTALLSGEGLFTPTSLATINVVGKTSPTGLFGLKFQGALS